MNKIEKLGRGNGLSAGIMEQKVNELIDGVNGHEAQVKTLNNVYTNAVNDLLNRVDKLEALQTDEHGVTDDEYRKAGEEFSKLPKVKPHKDCELCGTQSKSEEDINKLLKTTNYEEVSTKWKPTLSITRVELGNRQYRWYIYQDNSCETREEAIALKQKIEALLEQGND